MKAAMVLIFAGCLTFLDLFPATAYDRRAGARPLGMGDAFVAIVDDMNALNYNPAGLAQIRALAATIEYANLYPGLDDGVIQENHLAYVQPLPSMGGLGIAWNNRAVMGVYNENEIIAGYGLQPSLALPFWVGLACKFFYLTYTDPQTLAANSYFSGLSDKYQVGFDAAVLYELRGEQESFPGMKAGLSLLNLNQPDLGVRAEARQPLEIRLGGAGYWQAWDGAVDLVWKDPTWQIHLGAEKWFQERSWAVRAGLIAGEETGLTWTVGGSYAFELASIQTRLNYAFDYSFGGIQETGGIHRVSLDLFYPQQTGPSQLRATELAGNQSRPKAAAGGQASQLARIKNYLLNKIDVYFLAFQKISAGKENPALKNLPALSAAEDKLHTAVGQLVMYQDILGFLRNVDEAVQLLQTIEGKFSASPSGP